jgi:hypothetical protein
LAFGMAKVTIPIAVEVSDDTAAALGKGAEVLKTAVGLVRTARDMKLGEQIADALAAARKAGRRRR